MLIGVKTDKKLKVDFVDVEFAAAEKEMESRAYRRLLKDQMLTRHLQ